MSRRAARVAAVVLAAMLAGCGSVEPARPPASAFSSSSPSGAIKRCSPSDPDRNAWFCVIGQLFYNVAGGMQPDGGYSIR